jgi:hypothetical protein
VPGLGGRRPLDRAAEREFRGALDQDEPDAETLRVGSTPPRTPRAERLPRFRREAPRADLADLLGPPDAMYHPSSVGPKDRA